MKVRALRDYNDLQLKALIKAGTEFDVPEKRAMELSGKDNKAGMALVELLEEVSKPKTSQNKPTTRKASAKKYE